MTMKRFMSNKNSSKSVAEPSNFTKDMDWDDWYPTAINYFRMVSGNSGIPLSYIQRQDNNLDPTPNPDFKNDYVMNPSLTGPDFVMDTQQVHSAIRKLIMGNTEAEAIVKPHKSEGDGRKDWKALRSHYEGEGIYANNIVKATHLLETLYYIDEGPHTHVVDQIPDRT